MSDFHKINKLELEILELRVLLERALLERDRARATAVRLEQEIALGDLTREEQ